MLDNKIHIDKKKDFFKKRTDEKKTQWANSKIRNKENRATRNGEKDSKKQTKIYKWRLEKQIKWEWMWMKKYKKKKIRKPKYYSRNIHVLSGVFKMYSNCSRIY